MGTAITTIAAALSEFLAAPAADGRTNDDVVVQALGHMGVRDRASFDAVAMASDKQIETFAEAFAACCVPRTTHGQKQEKRDGRIVVLRTTRQTRDWLDFDIRSLRDCVGGLLAPLQLPERVIEAQMAAEYAAHCADAAELAVELEPARVLALSAGLSWPLDEHEIAREIECANDTEPLDLARFAVLS